MAKFLKENWFKIIITVAILIVAVSVGYHFISISSKQQQIVNNDISSQTKCADEAKQYFENHKNDLSPLQNYENHWNQKLNTCFIKITSTYFDSPTSNSGTGIELDDAIGGVYYGTLINETVKGITVCIYGKSDGEGHGMQRCKTADDFYSYMKSIMEN
jgi:hypothetical protein